MAARECVHHIYNRFVESHAGKRGELYSKSQQRAAGKHACTQLGGGEVAVGRHQTCVL
jgi:hypothetical protein